LSIVKKHRNGVGFAAIQTKTGYDEKKLRNIIFRLNKLGRISRKERGTYVAA
jgi:predicted transcriptional regulator of viral defense system